MIQKLVSQSQLAHHRQLLGNAIGSEQPPPVVALSESLPRTIDRIRQQQVTSLAAQLLETAGTDCVIGSTEGCEAKQVLTRGTTCMERRQQIRHRHCHR